jgi:hypothetical protein
MIRRPNYFQVGVLLMLTMIVTTLVPRPMAAQRAPQKKSSQAQPSSPDIVPAEFIGDWVPSKDTCKSPLRFRAGGKQLTLINGQDQATFGDLAIPTSYFGPDYNGISTVVVPEISGNDPPFNVFFNHDEKKGVTLVDIYTETPLSKNAVLAAMQMAHKKLAQRFPLNAIPLKKCPSNSGTTAPSVKGPSAEKK